MALMKELIEAGLFGRGLVPVENRTMVARYNACLKDMGLAPTNLKKFQIDKMGWSPEVAAEQKDEYYLSHGDANPLAIILTPEQATAPIYFPMHSFDWKLMDSWYAAHKVQIADLTRDTAIWLDIDQEVDAYQIPTDLLMVKEVMVRVHTPDQLIDRAIAQDGLVRQWLTDPNALFDSDFIEMLEKSAKEDGDLRRRQFVLRDMQFSDVSDFYSRVFGGVFVLRSQNHEPLVFVRDLKQVDEKVGIYPADASSLSKLIEHGYVDTNIDWWQDHLYRLKVVAESFLVDVLDREEPRLDYADLNDAKRKQFVRKYEKQLIEYLELMRAYKALEAKKMPKQNEVVGPHLLHPSDQLSPISREMVWQLLTYIRGGRFIPLMYRHQKSAFVRSYTKEWKKPKRSWALACVRDFYEVASKSSGLEL